MIPLYRIQLASIAIALEQLKQYDAPWLKNADSVFRDATGRFASKGVGLVKDIRESKTVKTLEDAAKLVAETGDIGIDSLAALLTDSEFRRQAKLETDLAMSKIINRLASSPETEARIQRLSEEVSKDVFRDLAKDEIVLPWKKEKFDWKDALKNKKKSSPPAPAPVPQESEEVKSKLETITARFQTYKKALRKMEKGNEAFDQASQFLRDGIYLTGAISAAVGPAVAIPYLATGTIDLVGVAVSIASSQVAYEVGMQVPEDWNPWLKVGTQLAMEMFAASALTSFSGIGIELTRSGLSSRHITSKSIPRLQEAIRSSQKDILSMAGEDRSKALLNAKGFKNLDDLDKEIGSLSSRLNPNFSFRDKAAQDLDDLIAFRRTVSAPEMAARIQKEGEKSLYDRSFYDRILRSESRYSKEMDEIVLAKDDKSLDAAYKKLFDKLTKGRPSRDKEIVHGEGVFPLTFGSQTTYHQSVGLSKKEVEWVRETSNNFDRIFDTDLREIMFVKNLDALPYMAGGKGVSRMPKSKFPAGTFEQFPELNKVSKILNINGSNSLFTFGTPSVKQFLEREGRLPTQIGRKQASDSILFHELGHALELDNKLGKASAQIIKARVKELAQILKAYGDIPPGKEMEFAQKILRMSESYAGKIYPGEYVTEFLSTAAEKIADPKSLQLGLRNDREKIMYLLSFAANT